MDYINAITGRLILIRSKYLALIPNNILGLIIYYFSGNKILEYNIVCKRWNNIIDSILCNGLIMIHSNCILYPIILEQTTDYKSRNRRQYKKTVIGWNNENTKLQIENITWY